MIKAAILTISDSCAQGQREDISGKTIEDMLDKKTFEICCKAVVPDDRDAIADRIRYFSDTAAADVVLTTGGTGLGPRDVTPEATQSVCDKMVPGLAEIIRLRGSEKTKNAVLSRAVAGIRNKTLIVNLPGSPKGVKESLELILDLVPHALDMMRGGGH